VRGKIDGIAIVGEVRLSSVQTICQLLPVRDVDDESLDELADGGQWIRSVFQPLQIDAEVFEAHLRLLSPIVQRLRFGREADPHFSDEGRLVP